MLFPEPKDENWHGSDNEGEVVHAVCCDLRSIRFCEMKSGGPFDGGVSAVIGMAVRKANGKLGDPVTLILSPDDTISMVGTCVEASVPDDDEDDYGWSDGTAI